MADYSALRRRIEDYRSNTRRMYIDGKSPTAIIDIPVRIGVDGFINPSEITTPEQLPNIPPKQRDFVFKYATEYKSLRKWADEYGVGSDTIYKWLSKPGVQAAISLVRYQRRMWKFAMSQRVETEAYRALLDVLRARRTSENLPTIQRAAEYVFDVLHNRKYSRSILREQDEITSEEAGRTTQGDVKGIRDDIRELDDIYYELIGEEDE